MQQMPFEPNVLIIDIEGSEADIPVAHLRPFEKIIVELHGRFIGDEKIAQWVEGLRSEGFQRVAQDGYSSVFVRASARATAHGVTGKLSFTR